MAEDTSETAKRQSERAADVRHAAVGGGTNLLALVAGVALPAYHALAARVFGAAKYGLYSVGLGVVEVLSRLGALGTDKGLLRFVPMHRVGNEPELERRSLSSAVWATVIAGAVLALCALVFAEPLAMLQKKPATIGAIRWLAPLLPLWSLFFVLISATMAAKVMRYNLVVRGVALPLVLMAVVVPTGLFRPSLATLCGGHVVAVLCVVVLSFFAVRKVFPDSHPWRPNDGGGVHWDMLRFSAPMGASEFLNGVLHRAGLILLARYVTEVDLGAYAAVELMSRSIAGARNAFDSVVSPVLAESFKQGSRERLEYNLRLMTRWVMLLTFPIIIFFVAFRVEILALFGKEFAAGTSAFLLLNLGYFTNGVLGLTGWVVAMSGRSRLVLLNNLIASGANVALCLVLAPRFGLIGAAIAASSGLVLIQLLQIGEVAVLHRTHAFSWSTLRAFLAGAITMACAIWAAPQLPGPVVLRMAYGLVALLVLYGALVFASGLTEEDKRVFASVRRRIGGGRR